MVGMLGDPICTHLPDAGDDLPGDPALEPPAFRFTGLNHEVIEPRFREGVLYPVVQLSDAI